MKAKAKNIIASLIIGSCVTSSSFATDVKSMLHKQPKNHIELMFFQQAHSGLIKPSTSGCYDLVLMNNEPDVMYFSNAPVKTAGNLTLAEFVETINHSQIADKVEPNALIHFKQQAFLHKRAVNTIGILSNAKYAHKQFHYTFCPFNGNNAIKQGQIRSVNLFIDPIHRWPP